MVQPMHCRQSSTRLRAGENRNVSDKATFAPCPNWLLRRRDVPATAKLLYARIVQYVGNNEMAYPSLPTLADEIGLHRSRVIAHLKALETLKLIRVHRTFGRGNQYELLSHPWSKTSSVSATSSESASATSSISTTAPVAETALLPVAFPLPKENKVKEHVKRSPEKNTPATVSIPDSLNVPEFRTAWSEFQEHWKQLRKRLTPLAAKKQLA